MLGLLELAWTDPAVLHRRVDVGRIRRRAADAGEAERAVVGQFHRAGFLAELSERFIPQRQARLIEGVKILEDQQSDRLAKIERRLSHGAHEVAGIEFRNPNADPCEIVGCHHRGRLQWSGEPGVVEANVDMRRIRCTKKDGVRRFRRPARHVRGAKIGCVELGPGDLGHAVDAADAGRGRTPLTSSRQRLPRGKPRFFGGCQACKRQRDATRDACLQERATRNAVQSSHGAIQIRPLSATLVPVSVPRPCLKRKMK